VIFNNSSTLWRSLPVVKSRIIFANSIVGLFLVIYADGSERACKIGEGRAFADLTQCNHKAGFRREATHFFSFVPRWAKEQH
jgi:hypothetical protein